MTANTDEHEQLRLIFLEQVGHLITDGTIETRSLKRAGISFACGNLHAAFLAWQAARHAPVVPHGWKLVPEWPTVQMSVAGDDVYREDGPDVFSSNTIYTCMIAAAPQPPGVNYAEFDRIKSAPVQLPEPEATVCSKLGTTCMFSSTTMRKGDKIYTEPQMRGMLS